MVKIWISAEEAKKRGYNNPYENANVETDYVKQQNSEINSTGVTVDPKMNTENPTVGFSPNEKLGTNAGYLNGLITGIEKAGEYIGKEMALFTINPSQAGAQIKKDFNSAVGYAKNFLENTPTDGSLDSSNHTISPNMADLSEEDIEEISHALDVLDNNPETKVENTDNNLISDETIEDISNQISSMSRYYNSIDEALKNNFNYTISNSKKVSLNIAPIKKETTATNFMSEDEWGARLKYVLGDSGFLYDLFGKTSGIVFPYTPDINFQHTVNYEETDILHSNLAVQHYKNTPPPPIDLKADFTADTLENAKYMYGVIHFLRSISKCEFGEEVVKNSEQQAGVPPPILYLNGWGNFMDNIPVVITSFGINLPKDKHYVNFSDNGKDIWLPTDITINIQMKIQFNLDKYKHQFDLNKYKKGILGNDTVTTNEKTNEKTTEYFNLVKDVVSVVNKSSKNNTTKYSVSQQTAYRRYNGSGWTW